MGSRLQVGDRVHLWLGTPARGRWHDGTVIGIDTRSHPGIEVRLDDSPYYDANASTVYATHREVWPGEHLPRRGTVR